MRTLDTYLKELDSALKTEDCQKELARLGIYDNKPMLLGHYNGGASFESVLKSLNHIGFRRTVSQCSQSQTLTPEQDDLTTPNTKIKVFRQREEGHPEYFLTMMHDNAPDSDEIEKHHTVQRTHYPVALTMHPNKEGRFSDHDLMHIAATTLLLSQSLGKTRYRICLPKAYPTKFTQGTRRTDLVVYSYTP